MKFIPLGAVMFFMASWIIDRPMGWVTFLGVFANMGMYIAMDMAEKKQLIETERKILRAMEKQIEDMTAKITTIEGVLNYQKGIKRG